MDVKREDLRRSAGRLVEQPPQRLFSQRHAVSAPEPLELRVGDGAGAVGGLSPAVELEHERRFEVAVAACPAQEGSHRRQVAVVTRWLELAPELERGRLELGLGRPALTPARQIAGEAFEGEAVGAGGERRELRAGAEVSDRGRERGVRAGHGRECAVFAGRFAGLEATRTRALLGGAADFGPFSAAHWESNPNQCCFSASRSTHHSGRGPVSSAFSSGTAAPARQVVLDHSARLSWRVTLLA